MKLYPKEIQFLKEFKKLIRDFKTFFKYHYNRYPVLIPITMLIVIWILL
jgi:hypothetical protein